MDPVLASRGTAMSKTVLVHMELSEWGRQTSDQAIEREIGKGTRMSSVVKWGEK